MMEPSTIKAEILSAISLELDVWLSDQEAIKDGYEYERRYIEFTQKIKMLLKNYRNAFPVLTENITRLIASITNSGSVS